MKESTTRISAAVTEMREARAKYLTTRDAYDIANEAAALVDSDAYAAADAAVRDALCAKNSAHVAYLAAAHVVRCLQNNKNQ
jgi:predicted RNA-binding protein associated with RNAse of E/G family